MLTIYPHSHLAETSQHLYLIISANLLKSIYLKLLKQKRKLDLEGIGVLLTKMNSKKKSSWDNVTSPHIDTNTRVSKFYFKIENLFDEMAPVKKLTKKEIGLQQRPWMTPDIWLLLTNGINFIRCLLKTN